ncbi:hypothetical protein DRN73_07270 [Candidatus Pacearchaeota archaeon]|nr:MAG: hypothetical protein DRN73_07270 [Candidatus Pacearchaeota archaeon]
MKCIVARAKKFEEARKNINFLKEKFPKEEIGFVSDNDELNRKILEKEKIDFLTILQNNRKDRQKQRNSGFNQVMAKIAKKNNIKIGICLDEIIKSKSKQKADILARIRQNIKLCSKNKLNMKFCGETKRDNYDLKALGLVLGMPTWMTKKLF